MAVRRLERVKVVALVALVAGSAALTLKLLDALPAVFSSAHAERTFASVADLERTVHRRLALPAYFPSSLRWPASTVRLNAGGSAATVVFAGKVDGRDRLVLVQMLEGDDSLPDGMRPPGALLGASPVRIGAVDGRLSRIRAPDGAIWNEVSWRAEGAALSLRFNGSVEELLRIAGSIHREGR